MGVHLTVGVFCARVVPATRVDAVPVNASLVRGTFRVVVTARLGSGLQNGADCTTDARTHVHIPEWTGDIDRQARQGKARQQARGGEGVEERMKEKTMQPLNSTSILKHFKCILVVGCVFHWGELRYRAAAAAA